MVYVNMLIPICNRGVLLGDGYSVPARGAGSSKMKEEYLQRMIQKYRDSYGEPGGKVVYCGQFQFPETVVNLYSFLGAGPMPDGLAAHDLREIMISPMPPHLRLMCQMAVSKFSIKARGFTILIDTPFND